MAGLTLRDWWSLSPSAAEKQRSPTPPFAHTPFPLLHCVNVNLCFHESQRGRAGQTDRGTERESERMSIAYVKAAKSRSEWRFFIRHCFPLFGRDALLKEDALQICNWWILVGGQVISQSIGQEHPGVITDWLFKPIYQVVIGKKM